jgi:hypothetical protein
MAIFSLPGANDLQLSADVRSTMDQLAKHFPKGIEYRIAYGPTMFVMQRQVVVDAECPKNVQQNRGSIQGSRRRRLDAATVPGF